MSSSARRPGTSSSRRWALIGAYLLGLYTWWVLCGFYFGIGEAGPAAVQPEADPSLECHRMRVAYEVTPGREWGKLPSALQARWKEIRCDEHEKGAAHAAALHPEEGAAVATPERAAVSASTPTAAAVSATAASTAPVVAAASAANAAAVASASAATPPTDAASNCPAERKPYHTLLTGQGTTYNGWQSRIMYYRLLPSDRTGRLLRRYSAAHTLWPHCAPPLPRSAADWKKVRKRDGPCTEMTGFTRLCASKDGEPDGLEKYIPSVFVRQLTSEELAKRGSWLGAPSALFEGSAPSGSLNHRKARAVPAHPGAPLEQLGGSPWPEKLASARPEVGGCSPLIPPARYGHFGVLNRPHSVVEGLKKKELLDRITEARPAVPLPLSPPASARVPPSRRAVRACAPQTRAGPPPSPPRR